MVRATWAAYNPSGANLLQRAVASWAKQGAMKTDAGKIPTTGRVTDGIFAYTSRNDVWRCRCPCRNAEPLRVTNTAFIESTRDSPRRGGGRLSIHTIGNTSDV